MRGQLEQARQEEFHVTSRLRRLEEEDAADGRQLQQRHATLDSRIAEVGLRLRDFEQKMSLHNISHAKNDSSLHFYM